MTLEAGLRGSASLTVTDRHLAIAARSGDVPVLATPLVVGLCEEATVDAVAPALGSGETTVGVHVDVEHLAASVVGARVTATAALETVDERRLTFGVVVNEGGVIVAQGTITRVVVDRARFVGRLSLR